MTNLLKTPIASVAIGFVGTFVLGLAIWGARHRRGQSIGQTPGGKARGRNPKEFDQAQLRKGIKVEFEHTSDREIARKIAMDHLVEDPNYYRKLAKIHLDGVTIYRGYLIEDRPTGGYKITRKGRTVAPYAMNVEKARHLIDRGLRGFDMLATIAKESRSPEEFARRAEAWAAGEAKPPSDSKLVRAYRGAASSASIARLIRQARTNRQSTTRARFKALIKQPTKSTMDGLAGYRVAYGTSAGYETFRAFQPHTFSTIEAATKHMRSLKRRGFWAWVEDEQGNFIPVPGAKSEKIRKGYPLKVS